MATFSENITALSGLVHYWPLDDVHTTNDMVGSADFTNNGTVTFGTTGATFNGQNYLQAADTSDMSIATTGELTIMAFMQVTQWAAVPGTSPGTRLDTNQNQFTHWLGKTDRALGKHEYVFRHYWYPVTAENRFTWCSGYVFPSVGGTGAGSRFYDGAVNATSAERFFCMPMDKTTTSGPGNDPNNPGRVWAYLNATLNDNDGMLNYPVDFVNTAAPFRVGGLVGYGAYFIGKIRRVAIFNRKLTPSEITSINSWAALPEGTAGGGGGGTGDIYTGLRDDFSAASLGSKWTTNSTGTSIVAGKAAIAATTVALTNGLRSGSIYKLTNSSVQMEAIPPPNSDAATDCYVRVLVGSAASPTNYIYMLLRNRATDPRIYFTNRLAGVDSPTSISGTENAVYNPTTMRYIRMRDDGTNLHFEYSADAVTWTDGRVVVRPSWVASATDVGMEAEVYKSAGTMTAATIDDLNPPAVTLTTVIDDTFENYTVRTWPVSAPAPEGGIWNVDSGATPAIAGTSPDKYLLLPGIVRSVANVPAQDITIEVDIARTTAPTTQAGSLQLWWGRVYARGDDQYQFLTRQEGNLEGWSLYKGTAPALKPNGSSTFGNAGTYQRLKITHIGTTITIYRDGTEIGVITNQPQQNGSIILKATEGVYKIGKVLVTQSELVDPEPPAATAPGTPIVTATAGALSVGLGWTVPPSGGSTITGYEVRRGTLPWVAVPNTTTSYTFTGLIAGTNYSFGVRAINAINPGLEGTATATPFASPPVGTFPSEPLSVTATAGVNSAIVDWTVPSTPNGTIVSYTIVDQSENVLGSTSGSVTIATITGLTNGMPYSFRVYATNATGNSDFSLPTSYVVPLASGSASSALNLRTALGAYYTDIGNFTLQNSIGQVFQPRAIRLPVGVKLTSYDPVIVQEAQANQQAIYVMLDMSGVHSTNLLNGTRDTQLAAMAKDFDDADVDVYVAPYFDANVWLNPWSPGYSPTTPGYDQTQDCAITNTDMFKLCFDKVVRVMSTLSGRNASSRIRYVWQATVDPQPAPMSNDWAQYYPGDICDVISLRGMNYGVGPEQGVNYNTTWREPGEVFDAPYTEAAALHPTKPIWLYTASHDPSEFYAPAGPGFDPGVVAAWDPSKSKPNWITTLMASTSWPRVQTVIWHSANDTRAWDLRSSPESIAAMRATIPGGGTWVRTDVHASRLADYARTSVRAFASWARRGVTWTNPYDRPDANTAAGARASFVYGLPYSSGAKSLTTISEADANQWDAVHGIILRSAARNGMLADGTASGQRPLNDPVLLWSGDVTGLFTTRDGIRGTDMLKAAGMRTSTADSIQFLNVAPEEYEWHGAQLTGGVPSATVPQFLKDRNIKRLRFELADTTILPSGTTMPTQLTTDLNALMGAAVVAGTKVHIAVTWNSRPTVARGKAVLSALMTPIGIYASQAFGGVSLYSAPTYGRTAAANDDADASMVAYKTASWSAVNDPTTADHVTARDWLETWSAQVLTHLRLTYATQRFYLPVFYAPGNLIDIAKYHPNGPWVTADANVWYESAFYPAGLDETQISHDFAYYDTNFGRGTAYNDQGFFSEDPTTNTVVAPDPLSKPLQAPLGDDPNNPVETVGLPVEDLIGTAYDGAVELTWIQPDHFGTGTFIAYQVMGEADGLLPVEWRSTTVGGTTILVGPLANDAEYLFTVRVLTSAGVSEPTSVTVTPNLAAGASTGEMVTPYADPNVSEADPLVFPQPWVEAFRRDVPFVPSEWMHTVLWDNGVMIEG